MNENYIEQIIKKHTKTTLLFLLVLILITVSVFLANDNLLSTLYTPLSSIKSSDNATELFKQKKVYAQLENADLYFTDYGIYTYTTRNGVKTSEEKLSQVFGVVRYEDGYLLTLVPKSYTDLDETALQSVSATCKVQALNEDEHYTEAYNELVSEIMSSTKKNREEVEQAVPRLCLTVQEDGRVGDQAIVIIDLLAFVLLIIFMLINILVLFDHKKSKLYQQLNFFGSAEDVEYSINQSVETGNYLYKNIFKPAQYIGLLTPQYLIARSGSSLRILPTRDLLWAHLKITKQKAYFITVNKSVQVLFYVKEIKRPVSITFKNEQQANEVIGRISANLPVICGYDKNLARIYKSNREEFLRIAEQYSHDFFTTKSQQNAEQPEQA